MDPHCVRLPVVDLPATMIRRDCLLLMLLGVLRPVQADEPPLRAGIFEVPPLGMRARDGTLSGILCDLFLELQKSAGVDVRMEMVPLARVVKLLDTSQIDLAILNGAIGLAPGVRHVGRVATVPLLVAVNADSPLGSTLDLAGARVGVLNGGGAARAAARIPGVLLVPVTGIPNMISMLRLRRVDAIVLSQYALDWHLKENSQADKPVFRRIGQMASYWELYGGRHLDEALIERLRPFVALLHDARRFDELAKRYLVS